MATFTILVTYHSLCELTKQFMAGTNLAPNRTKLLGDSLCAQLQAAQDANARDNLEAKAGAIDAYVKQVRANTPAVFTEDGVSLWLVD